MALLSRLNPVLVLVAAMGMAGCSNIPAHADTRQDGEAEFFLQDENVRGFARLDGAGNLEIIPNRALSSRGMTEVYAPGSDYFQLFTSALGGLGPGEIKRVPKYSGLAFMQGDGTIVVNYVSQTDGVDDADPIFSPPRSFSYSPSSPGYSASMEMFRVRKPGDGYLIPAQ